MLPISAPSGAEALRLLSSDNGVPFDAAILDAQMPGMSGLELARIIRKSKSPTELPLILLSSTERSAFLADRAAGIAACLTKPVRGARLKRTLQAVFEPKSDTGTASLEPASAQSSLATGDILIVDDNPVNQRLARRLVEKIGYEVDVVSDGSDAVAALGQRRYDAVLMDCHMPVMDGFEATRRIRKTSTVPVIAMTASARTGDRERCNAAGRDDFVSKPIKIDLLAEALQRWVGQLRTRSGEGSVARPIWPESSLLVIVRLKRACICPEQKLR